MSSDSERNPVELLAEEFVERRRQGESITIEDYVAQFPDLGDEIRDVFPMLVMMERLGEADSDNEAPRAAEPPPLKRVGDYRIVGEIGRGGMGVVYEAEQESLGRRVALKVMLPNALLDARQRARFEREARAAARLHHTNIVPVFGVGRQENLHYFVMQLIDGQGLDKVLFELRRMRQPEATANDWDSLSRALTATTTPLEPRAAAETGHPTGAAATESAANGSSENPISSGADSAFKYYHTVARLTAQAADALDYANAQGVLHRDVKPANLLLDGTGTLWVTDFGLAKAADSDDLTNTGDVVGTLRYMAPERFANECTAQSDIYGLGLTLYELITLQPAYDEPDRAAMIARIMNESPPALRKLAPNVPRDLETILLKAIAHDSAERYATAGEFGDDLRRFLEDRPIQARRISPLERSWRWCRRNPVVASLTACVVALLIAVSIAYVNVADSLRAVGLARSSELSALAEAKQRADDAEAAEAIAADAVDEYFTKVSQSQLIDVPGMQPLRHELLTSALQYYEKLIERQHRRPALQRELALAHQRVAQINSLIGSSEKAVDHFQLALQILDELPHDPVNADSDNLLAARCERQLGTVQQELSRFSLAEGHLDRAIARFEALSPRLLMDHVRVEKAYAYARRGVVRHSRQENTLAVEDCEKAVSILQEIDNESSQVKDALATVLMMLGNVHADEEIGDFSKAIEPYTEVVKIRRTLLSADPRRTYARTKMALALYNLGRAHFAGQRVDEALELFEESLELNESMLRENPDVGTYQTDVVFGHQRLGLVLGRVERRQDAIGHYRRAIELQEDLCRRHPEEGHYQRVLADLWYGLGVQQQHATQAEDAEASFFQAVTVVDRYLAITDETLIDQRFLSEMFNRVGSMKRMGGDLLGAMESYRRAVTAVESLIEEQGRTIENRVSLGNILNNLALAETESLQLDLAAETFADACNHFAAILEEDPDHGTARMGLYSAHRGRGTALDNAERFNESVKDWTAARKLAPPEHVTYATTWHGFAMARSGDHLGAAEAAEQMHTGESLKFYYNLENGPALLKHLSAAVLAAAASSAAEDPSHAAEQRAEYADRHTRRALQLLQEAFDSGLYEDPAQRRSLLTHHFYDPLRDHEEFIELLERLSDASADSP